MKAFIFRSPVKSVRYEVFETIINMISPIYRQIVYSVHSRCTKMYINMPTRNVVYAFNIM